MSTHANNNSVTAGPQRVDDAVGVPDAPRQWYIARCRNRAEKVVADSLTKLGYTAYVATQQLMRVWRNGRRAIVDHVVIPSTVFVYCTERQRRNVVVRHPGITRFMTDRATRGDNGLNARPAVVSQREIDLLRFMLGQSDIPVDIDPEARPLTCGETVRVIRGALRGLEGRVMACADNKNEVIVSLDTLGCARLTIAATDLLRTAD